MMNEAMMALSTVKSADSEAMTAAKDQERQLKKYQAVMDLLALWKPVCARKLMEIKQEMMEKENEKENEEQDIEQEMEKEKEDEQMEGSETPPGLLVQRFLVPHRPLVPPPQYLLDQPLWSQEASDPFYGVAQTIPKVVPPRKSMLKPKPKPSAKPKAKPSLWALYKVCHDQTLGKLKNPWALCYLR